MKTVAAHTLGCKVNQYDTQAMLELFLRSGWKTVPMDSDADAYLINTCTVTGVGDRKSLQLIRRIRREHPDSKLIVCGCMAQMCGEALFSSGADVVLGTQNRHLVVQLLEEACRSGKPVSAVTPLDENTPFECLSVSSQNERTRAVIKIQEGCRNRCSYCIIPSVRGPIRSRPLDEIRSEISRLSQAGYRELVLTGIHLTSYGKEIPSGPSLTDVIRLAEEDPGILRIRLGSLEPTFATEETAAELKRFTKLCPQFHLALQSGSDTVLARMRRRYTAEQYLAAVGRLRAEFPLAALTTDILTGFPGETEQEYRETRDMIRKVGFARIHVFPYSPRPGTPAAGMPGQLSTALKETRARELIALGHETALLYLRQWEGRETEVLPETKSAEGWEGYTPEYIRVRLRPEAGCRSGVPVRVRLYEADSRGMRGELI